jgi:hypothetical protein
MIEANESPYDGVKRELREELDLAVTVGSLLLRRLDSSSRTLG